MKISILIPTFNRADRLEKAIKSALNQDYSNLEIIVSDNNSTDNTFEIVSDFFDNPRFKYFKNDDNIGAVRNIGNGISNLISGDYFLVLCDDDYLINNKYISQAVNIIKNNKNILMVSSQYYFTNEGHNTKNQIKVPFKTVEKGKDLFMKFMKVKHITGCLSTTLFNRKFAIKTKSFINQYDYGSDTELILKSCLCGNVGLIKDFSLVYNYHPNNESETIYDNYNVIVNNVNLVVNPFNLALKYNKLTDSEKKYWEDFILVKFFIKALSHTLFYFPEKFEDAIENLSLKNQNVLNKALKDKKFQVIKFLFKIKLFKYLYKFARYLIYKKLAYDP